MDWLVKKSKSTDCLRPDASQSPFLHIKRNAWVVGKTQARSAAVAAARYPAAASCRNCALWQRWNRQKLQAVVPIMPGTRVEQTRRRIVQGFAKSVPAIMIESNADVLPCPERHDPAEKHWRISKGRGNWFPPTYATGYCS